MYLRFLLPMLAVAACDRTTTGERGVIEFTPDDCGALSCDLADGIATGSTLAILLEFSEDNDSLDRGTLVSEDPSIVEVTGETGVLNPRFRVVAHAPGQARLVATGDCYSGCFETTDAITVDVVDPSDIAIAVGNAGTPERIDASTERYTIRADTQISIDARPQAFGRELTGEVAYTTTLSSGLANAVVGPNPNFTRADFDLRPPVGTHTIRLELATGPARTIEIIAN